MAKLTWSFPADKEAGFTGFKIYYGIVSKAHIAAPQHIASHLPYEFYIVATPASKREIELPSLPPGVWFFRMTAFSTTKESLFSDEISYEFEDTAIPEDLHVVP